jgi:hypothetical protein
MHMTQGKSYVDYVFPGAFQRGALKDGRSPERREEPCLPQHNYIFRFSFLFASQSSQRFVMNSTYPKRGLDAYFVWPDSRLNWDPPYTHLLTAAVLGMISFMIFTRLVFHPLAHVPGPRLAGFTKWYEFYYDVVCDGEYLNHIERMHATYSMFPRVSDGYLLTPL